MNDNKKKRTSTHKYYCVSLILRQYLPILVLFIPHHYGRSDSWFTLSDRCNVVVRGAWTNVVSIQSIILWILYLKFILGKSVRPSPISTKRGNHIVSHCTSGQTWPVSENDGCDKSLLCNEWMEWIDYRKRVQRLFQDVVPRLPTTYARGALLCHLGSQGSTICIVYQSANCDVERGVAILTTLFYMLVTLRRWRVRSTILII